MSAENTPAHLIENVHVALIPLLPLIGAGLTYIVGSVFSKASLKGNATHGSSHSGGSSGCNLSGWMASFFSLATCALVVFLVLSNNFLGGHITYHWTAWSWIHTWLGGLTASGGSNLQNGQSGAFPHLIEINLAYQMDALAGVMALVVTGVGSLIHFYAIGYMHEDPEKPRFFAYLNLFMFAMLTLVLADNLLVMFIGWEGVGVCSYLLIGFWYREMPNAVAGQKAFVVNRIGDFGFILGIMLLMTLVGSVHFATLKAQLDTIPIWAIELAALCLFIGAVGKSAQIPLYVWLPDAMAGPTPVSALIHAATMVTAGVYMTTRVSFLFENAPTVLVLIAVIGALTAFVAATIALTQFDIKKVLAYSTVSQLGFMFMALGSGAFSNGIYHVVTHAFFKACLFMSAGSVIIGCHHEQDMRRFGGLLKKMPITALCYLGSTLAIAGFPYTSGFFSKDAILWTVYSSPTLAIPVFHEVTLAQLIWGLGLFTAFLTAFYMTRSFVMTFLGSYRGHAHPHESPLVVTIPLIILAILSLIFGGIWGERLMHLLSPWTRADLIHGHDALKANPLFHSLEILSMIVAVAAICLGWLIYAKLPSIAGFFATKLRAFYNFLQSKWYVDELYDFVICKPLAFISMILFKFVDRILIDGTLDRSADVVVASGEAVTALQVGRMGVYALVMLMGSAIILLYFFV